MPGGGKFLLDACALLRLLQDEPGADRVEAILAGARRGKWHVLIHLINLGEVVYTVAKEVGWKTALRKRSELLLLPMTVLPVKDGTFWKAVELKSRYAMSYADCFAVAAAIEEQATLLTSDPEFEPSPTSSRPSMSDSNLHAF
jgi:ribonuclease VapC